LVERVVWDHEVAGSNPVTPISLMFHVYVLKSERTGRCYIGSCEDLDQRIKRHNAAQNPATKHGVPWVLMYFEKWSSRVEAVRREGYFKTGKGREELAKRLCP
jgi:putative endonuclease